jgi:hypothetical protein
MPDSITALGPLAFRVTIDGPTQQDIAALRRGPMRITLSETPEGMFRWDFNWLQFGVFEHFVRPDRSKASYRIDAEGIETPGLSLSLTFEFRDHKGKPIGARLLALPRDVGLQLLERWNEGTGQPVSATINIPARA